MADTATHHHHHQNHHNHNNHNNNNKHLHPHHHHHHQHQHQSWSEGEDVEDRMRLEEEEEEEEEEDRNEVKEMAMVTLGLLKQEVKVMLNQVKHLVKANPSLAAQVFTTDVDGWTPVHACALRGRKKVLKAMVSAGIDVNCAMGQPEGLPARCTLLHIAANRPDKKVADYLIHHGADVRAKDSFGRTPLFYASRSGNRDVFKLLVDSGACPEVEVTSPPEEADGPGRKCAKDELVTPEPKLSRFCFLQLPHRHHQQQQQQHRNRRRRHRLGHHRSQSPPRGESHPSGHRSS